MNENLSLMDIISLIIGIASFLLAVYFIKDDALKLGLTIGIVVAIAMLYSVFVFKETKENSIELKTIQEKMNIYDRLNRIEALLQMRGEKK